jgi:hypothetical protein
MARVPLVMVRHFAAAAATSVGEGSFDIEKSQYKLLAFFRIYIAKCSPEFLFLASRTRLKEPRNIKDMETYRPQCGREVIVMDIVSSSLAASSP